MFLAAALPAIAASAQAEGKPGSGTYRGRIHTERLLHQQARQRRQAAALSPPSDYALREDAGEIAVIDTSAGVLIQPNRFDLLERSVSFQREPGGYLAVAAEAAYDETAPQQGLLLGLGDDDAEDVALPFAFPYFSNSYDRAFVHSDGNVTFEEIDAASTARSLPRALSGPPRIAPLFTDLDPSQPQARVTVAARLDRVVITWEEVPLFSRFGVGTRQTFQLILHLDGGIEYHYRTISLSDAVVGIMPGRLEGDTRAVDFSTGLAEVFDGALAEIFAANQSLDIFTAAQRFYQNHDDNYDILVLFNDIGLSPGPGAFAFEVNVRNEVRGIGDLLLPAGPEVDIGKEFGSRRRLQSFLNMGPLRSYPDDPTAKIPILGENNTLSVMGQEAGHRFLTYVRFLDPATGLPSSNLLGRDLAHWSFFFNSDASVVEGNRIEDRGAGVSPRFETVEAVARYSAFDQYLMGLRGPEETPPSFLVENAASGFRPNSAPRVGAAFDGQRKEIPIDLIIAAEGARVPHWTVAQKRFHFAFALLVREGEEPSAAALEKLDRVRTQWEDFFNQAVSGRGEAVTEINRLLHLSSWPAAGVLLGGEGQGAVEIASPRETGLDVMLTADPALITVPPVVTIAAGDMRTFFPVTSHETGVARLRAMAAEPGYDLAEAFVQVRDAVSDLRWEVVSGANQAGGLGAALAEPVILRLLDENRLPYSGITVRLSASGDGAADPEVTVTDSEGRVRVVWRLASEGRLNTLTARLAAAPEIAATVTALAIAGRPVFSELSVVNAASFNLGPAAANAAIPPGGLITIFGTALAPQPTIPQGFPLPFELGGTRVLINGVAAPLLFVSPGQINFQAPFELPAGGVEVVVRTAGGSSDPVAIRVASLQPGIFFDPASGMGAILTERNEPAFSHVAAAGEVIQIFCTGLGVVRPDGATGLPAPADPLAQTATAPRVLVGGREAAVLFSGLAPGFAGLYQVNATVPEDLPPGRHVIQIIVEGLASNEVLLDVDAN